MKEAVVLIDGEHYPPVVEEALSEIKQNYKIRTLVFLGGTEKIGSVPQELFGYELISSDDITSALMQALDKHKTDIVIDLSDEPVIGYRERFALMNIAVAKGIGYMAADFEITPVKKPKISKFPSIEIIGTGKRVGKTAISAYACRTLKKLEMNPVVVAMGRGGPPDPDVLYGSEIELTPQYLIQMSDLGKHAASDYYEDAMMSRITTVGCRRCGGGLAGSPFISNVLQGAYIANNLKGGIIIFEGSGSAIPPVYADKCLLTISASQPLEYVSEYFGPCRLLKSDIVFLTNCEEPNASLHKTEKIKNEIKKIRPDLKVLETVFRPKPLKSIENKKVFYATTAPKAIVSKLKEYLEQNFGCAVVGVSTNLSDRSKLKDELLNYGSKAEILLTELKAAAVDIAAKTGMDKGMEIVFCDNEPIPAVGNEHDLEKEIKQLAEKAILDFNRSL